jgi:cell division protein FtsL
MPDLKKHLTLNNIVLLLALLLAVSWAWSTIGALQKNYDLQRQVDEARLGNEVQEIENQNLALQQAYYQTDEYLELQARDKLNKALPGEHLIIMPKQQTDAGATPNTTQPTDNSTNLDKWMRFLFGRDS